MKLGMKYQALKLYKFYINYDPWMTLTYFTARSTLVAYAFEWGKLLKWDFNGKICRKWVNELEIYDSEKNLDPRTGSVPAPGHYFLFQSVQSVLFQSNLGLFLIPIRFNGR